VRIQGGASRLPIKSPKHSFRLLFRGDYGPTKLEFPLFADSPVDRFDALVLRAGYNNSWIHWAPDQRARADYVRDQWAKDTQLAMGQLSGHGIFVNLYLNGLYWGLFNLVERPEASFAASYLGGEKEDYDALNAENTLDGDRIAWNTLLGIAAGSLATEGAYQAIQKYLDVPNLIDYLILNVYAANQDWPSHNWYVVRRREPGAGYRFFSWDAERILEDPGSNSTGVADEGTPAKLYAQLRANPEFRLLFADHLHRHLLGAGALAPEQAADRFSARAGQIDLAVVCESARWGDYRRDVHQYSSGPYELYLRDLHWQREWDRLLAQYFPQRTNTVLAQFRAAGLYPGVGAPTFSRDGGTVPPGTSLTMSLPPGAMGAIYYTTDGSDPRIYGTGAVSGSALAYGGPVTIADYLRVKARILQGSIWSALHEAVFTVPAPLSALKITEIMYHPLEDQDYEFLELKNTGDATLDLTGLYFAGGIDFAFPAHAAIGPGQRLVLAGNPAAFAVRYPGVAVAGSFAGSRLSNGGERLTIKDAAGGEVLSLSYRDDGEWPLGPDGLGWSLVLADPASDPDDPRSWRASAAMNGSPGAEDPPPVHGGVVVSEVLTRAAAPLEAAIEIENLTAGEVNLGGWFLSDSRVDAGSLKTYRIPTGTKIAAGGFKVFYQYQFNAEPGGSTGFGLSPYGGGVYLASADSGGNLTGHVAGAEFAGAGSGESFGRFETPTGVDFPPLESRTFGSDSPQTIDDFRSGSGKPNSPPRIGQLVLNEILYHPLEGGEEFIEIYNRTEAQIPLHDPVAGVGFRIAGIRNLEGTDDFEFGPGTAVGGRGYLLVVAIDPAVFRSRYGIPQAVPIVGPFGGALDNSGERLKLLRPDATLSPPSHIVEDAVRYGARAPWPAGADGTGPSLERILASRYGNDPLEWAASLPAGGTPGGVNSRSAPPGNQSPVAAFSATPPTGPAPLEVSFDASHSYDPDGPIARYDWLFGDGTSASGAAVTHTFGQPGKYTVSLEVVDEHGARTTAGALVLVDDPAGYGLQRPGDGNGDGSADISDALALLGHLFAGGFGPLPCEGASAAEGGNRTLFDVSGDGAVDVSDAIHLLVYLFRNGSPPALGTACTPIRGCPDACGG
jgi:hypothetical protein